MFYYVRELVSVVTNDPEPVAVFTSFFDASDFVGEHPEMNLFIEMVDEFLPILTNEDLDAYRARTDAPGGVDPRNPDWDMYDLPSVLMFLAWAAQLKAMNTPHSDPGHFGYERMLYEYSKVADAICGY